MLFNIHFGQMRLRGGSMVFIDKSPMGKLVMQNFDKSLAGDKREYVADELGNIDVTDPRHIETMVGLGYPLYDGGNRKLCPVPLDDLLYPSINSKSEYWKRINQATNKTLKGG